MPRARTTTALEDEGVVKKPRATRARAVSSGEDAPRAPRKVVEPESEGEVVRKAPTPFREQRQASGKGARNLIIVVVFCSILISIGFGIGLSDKGQINVVAIVNERNEKISRGEVRTANGDTITQTIPVQGSDNRPNGGLRIADDVTPPAPPEVPPSSTTTASTTLESVRATSTESSGENESATTTPLE
jgi:hypothetical protein